MRSKDWKVELSVEFVPCPPEREAAYWAAIRILVRMLNEERSRDGGTALMDRGEQEGDAHGSEDSTEVFV